MIPLKDNTFTTGTPGVTIALIAVCLLVFCWQLTLSGADGSGSGEAVAVVVGGPSERDDFAADHATSPARIAETGDEEGSGRGPWWLSPLTAVPLASDLLHLAVNLLFLLIFGRTLEAVLGRARFVALMVAAALAGIGLQTLVDPDASELVLSASTALAGVMGAYAVLHPRAAVVSISLIPMFGTLLEVPALLLIGSWFLIALIPALGAVVDSHLLVGTGLELAGYGAALCVGIAVGLVTRDRVTARAEALG